jgi:hypothetical protein
LTLASGSTVYRMCRVVKLLHTMPVATKVRHPTRADGMLGADHPSTPDPLASSQVRSAGARLCFGDAASTWLDGSVLNLRPRTCECYRNAAQLHLLSSFGNRGLDSISPDVVQLVEICGA